MSKFAQKADADISILLSVFDAKTTSYKYLWFRGIMNLLEQREFRSGTLLDSDIIQEMLVEAWYPCQYFKLRLGHLDRVDRLLSQLDLSIIGKIKKENISKAINSSDISKLKSDLDRYVKYRFIRPWFKTANPILKGVEDHKVNTLIIEFAQRKSFQSDPLYTFVENGIQVTESWLCELKRNYALIENWYNWEWAKFLQTQNPTTPAIIEKIHPPASRDAIPQNIRKTWSNFINEVGSNCIYSGQSLDSENFTLDHFIPWSYVTHNEVWNLIPVPKNPNLNSIKGDTLPHNFYISEFVQAQWRYLNHLKGSFSAKARRGFVDSYCASLDLNSEDLFQEELFCQSLAGLLQALLSSADRQGFTYPWIYKKTSVIIPS